MFKKLFLLALFAMMVMATSVEADVLSGLADVTVEGDAIVSLRYDGTEYVVADGDLMLGSTTRWYVPADTGVETLWPEGDPAPDATVSGTSNPKEGDVGSKADNFLFTLDGGTNISSIDGIDFQETLFAVPTGTIFVFERGGNDTGTFQAILADGSLGAEVAFDKSANGGPYADTGVNVNGQSAYGVVFTTDEPVMGVRITASGHDALSISAPKVPVDPGAEGLVASYAFEGNAEDGSANALHGTLVGEPSFVESLTDYGMALDFDGIDDVVELGAIDVIGQITLAAWIKADDFEINDARIITKAQEWGGNDHWWMLSTISETSLRFRLKTDDGQETATLVSDSVLEAGTWAHVAATWDGGMMRIYKDGEEVASQEKGGSAVAVDPNISAAIGSQPSDAFASDPSHVAKYFDGLIDEVHIYERALADSEILYLADDHADPTLSIYYTFDEVSDIVADQSGKGHDGVVVGDISAVAEGILAGAGKFATGSYLDLDGINFPLEDIPTSAMTLAAWINCENTGGDHEIFSARASDSTWLIHPEPKSSGDIRWLLRAYGGTTIFQIRAGTMTWGEWLHFAGTYDKDAAKAALYVNGELIQEMDVENPADIAGDWGMGARVGLTIDDARPFTGLMDEFRMYTRALSPEEIAGL